MQIKKVPLSETKQRILELFADENGLNRNEALFNIINAALALVQDGRGVLLGPGWHAAWVAWREQAIQERTRQIADMPPIPTHINVLLLERKDGIASGFLGVYRNNQGWRARVVDPQTGEVVYLKTWANPEEAAWERYEWFKARGVPYTPTEKAREDIMRRLCARGSSLDSAIAQVKAQEAMAPILGIMPPQEFAVFKAAELTRLAKVEESKQLREAKAVLKLAAKQVVTLPEPTRARRLTASPVPALAAPIADQLLDEPPVHLMEGLFDRDEAEATPPAFPFVSAETLLSLTVPKAKPLDPATSKRVLIPRYGEELPLALRYFSPEEIVALPTAAERTAARVCSTTWENLERKRQRDEQATQEIVAVDISDEEEAQMQRDYEATKAALS